MSVYLSSIYVKVTLENSSIWPASVLLRRSSHAPARSVARPCPFRHTPLPVTLNAPTPVRSFARPFRFVASSFSFVTRPFRSAALATAQRLFLFRRVITKVYLYNTYISAANTREDISRSSSRNCVKLRNSGRSNSEMENNSENRKFKHFMASELGNITGFRVGTPNYKLPGSSSDRLGTHPDFKSDRKYLGTLYISDGSEIFLHISYQI